MKTWRIRSSLYVNFLLFAILMSSDGILILQVQKHYGIAPGVAGALGGFRDMSVAARGPSIVGFCSPEFWIQTVHAGSAVHGGADLPSRARGK